MNPNQHPNTILMLSADTDICRWNALTPDQRPNRYAVRRIIDTRRRIDRLMWAARAVVIREQLTAQRNTYA